mmetsp:Transcript_20288/g.31254  ORF Transcript_20288/g.31254 Transcript_20288/m.31254 type:complete len:224 (-) Transcript_20288:594-1265(-)
MEVWPPWQRVSSRMMLLPIMISCKNMMMIIMTWTMNHSCQQHPHNHPSYPVHPSKRNVSTIHPPAIPTHPHPSLPTLAVEPHPSTTFQPNSKCPKHHLTDQFYSQQLLVKLHGGHLPTPSISWMDVLNWIYPTLIPTIYPPIAILTIQWQSSSMHHKNHLGSVSTLPHRTTMGMIPSCSISTHVNSNGGDNWSLTIRMNPCGGMICRCRCRSYRWCLGSRLVR